MIITESGRLDSMLGPDRWFTGAVWIEAINEEPEPSGLRASRVFFSAGARTAWHTHPSGQTLRVIEGIARVQGATGPVREFGPGAVIRIEAEERHWHGALPDRPMVHLALQDAGADGCEALWRPHMTDEEYNA